MRYTAVLAALLAGCSRGPELVRRPASPPPALLIQGVGVLDVETGSLAQGRNVLITDGRIAKIGDGHLAAPEGAQTINGEGATLLPGLIDMHGHVGEARRRPGCRRCPTPSATCAPFCTAA